jgi:hypothetical protein
MDVCLFCVLSGRGLCVGLITRQEEFYRVWCVCEREVSITRRPWPPRGCCAMKKMEFIKMHSCYFSYCFLYYITHLYTV